MTPPPLHSFGDLSLQFPHAITLSNGITCHIVNGGNDDMNRISIFLPGGIMMTTKVAVPIITAMMLVEGNNQLSAEQVAEKFDFYAARKSADAYNYWTEVTMTSLNNVFSHTMSLLFDCITQPSFPEDQLEALKRRYAGGIQAASQRVGYQSMVALKKLYYGEKHPLAQFPTPDEIMAVTRQDLIDFYQRHLTAQRCRVIVSGKVTDDVLKTIDDTIGHWQDIRQTPEDPKWEINPSTQMMQVVDMPAAVQSAVRHRANAICRNHPDYLPLRVLTTVLGGYFGSRLMMNLREDKGYTYGIYSSLLGLDHDGCIEIVCECATEHTWNAIKEIKKEMSRLRQELVPQHELDTVRQHMLSELAKTHDTPFNIASYVKSTILYGMYPEYHNDQLRVINEITAEQIRDLACRYLIDDNFRIVIAGNQSQLQQLQ